MKPLARRLPWSTVAIGVTGALIVGLIAAIFASILRPAWYRPIAIDYSQLEADKRDLVTWYDRISGALNAGRSIEVQMDQDQLNRWVASREEIWPDLALRIEGAEDPLLRLGTGNRIEFGATVEHNGWKSVVSFRIGVGIEGRILAKVEQIRVGRLLFPLAVVWPLVVSRLNNHPLAAVELDGRTLRVFNEWVWENGRVPFRIGDLRVDDRRLHLRFDPITGGNPGPQNGRSEASGNRTAATVVAVAGRGACPKFVWTRRLGCRPAEIPFPNFRGSW